MSDRARVESFWRERYAEIRTTADGRAATWLDYASDEIRGQRLQAQTYALVLEAAGVIDGARILDAGCGWGRFSLALAALGGHVVGLDLIDATIATLRQQHPSLEWVAGNFLDPSVLAPLGAFDRIVALEVFQCAGEPADSLRALWPHVAPGGRLAAIMPNAACPIVQRAMTSLAGNFFAISPEQLRTEIEALPGVASFAMRGLSFAADQTLSPYAVSTWSQSAAEWPTANRMMIVVERA